MTYSMYALATGTFVPMLNNLSTILDKAAEHARANGQDPDSLVTGKLAPDMFDLARQVQIACDFANSAVARLKSELPPKTKNEERTLVDLKALIAGTVANLKSLQPADCEDAEENEIVINTPDGSARFEMNGEEYLRDWAMPHFYFHIVTAYDILRHAGVPLGKLDYMAHTLRFKKELKKD